jgi:hypothetical protein
VHIEFTRVNIELTITPKEIKEQRIVLPFIVFSNEASSPDVATELVVVSGNFHELELWSRWGAGDRRFQR